MKTGMLLAGILIVGGLGVAAYVTSSNSSSPIFSVGQTIQSNSTGIQYTITSVDITNSWYVVTDMQIGQTNYIPFANQDSYSLVVG